MYNWFNIINILFLLFLVAGIILLIFYKILDNFEFCIIGIFCSIFGFCCLIVALCNYCTCNMNYNKYLSLKELSEVIKYEDNVINNIGINDKLFEVNDWVINVKSEQSLPLIFRFHTSEFAEDLEYITFNK